MSRLRGFYKKTDRRGVMHTHPITVARIQRGVQRLPMNIMRVHNIEVGTKNDNISDPNKKTIFLTPDGTENPLLVEHEFGHGVFDALSLEKKLQWHNAWDKTDMAQFRKAFGEDEHLSGKAIETWAELYAARTLGWKNTRFINPPEKSIPQLAKIFEADIREHGAFKERGNFKVKKYATPDGIIRGGYYSSDHGDTESLLKNIDDQLKDYGAELVVGDIDDENTHVKIVPRHRRK